VAAHRYGLDRASLDERLPRVAEVPFDSNRKLMTTVHCLPAGEALRGELLCLEEGLDGQRIVAFAKGAADHLLSLC
jgi:magnesium-transporting ATPase (P-type)